MNLDGELEFLRAMFRRYRYPAGVINKYVINTPDIGRMFDKSSCGCIILHLPFVGVNNLDIKRSVRSVISRTFDDVGVVAVYTTRRAFMVKKDVLPTDLQSKIVYSFECRIPVAFGGKGGQAKMGTATEGCDIERSRQQNGHWRKHYDNVSVN